MKIKSLLAKPLASVVAIQIKRAKENALKDQTKIFNQQLSVGSKTLFGADHHLKEVHDYQEYKEAVPLRDYEALKPYIEKIKEGGRNILWSGMPIYFAKTSGTTSGAKHIPITKASIHNHIDTARNALLNYMDTTGHTEFADGHMIFLSGSPTLERVGNIPTGRLSGIVNHHIPSYLRRNQLPSFETNCIEDWEEKLANIVTETLHKDMTLISGIPPWVQMYFDWLLEKSGKENIAQLFPHLQIIVHGGVNFKPYKAKLFASLGKTIDTLETYPASEGFFAFQDQIGEPGLLLNTNSGIFFEFVPVDQAFQKNPPRLSLSEVALGVNYALIISSNAGLWGYEIGDTVQFVSLNPYRIVVTGRLKHFISAFGEHVIGEEVEKALQHAVKKHGGEITEFTVAPQVQVSEGLPYHEWFIEFEKEPDDLEAFALSMDGRLRELNSYYNDLIKGAILRPLKITRLKPQAFKNYMKAIGKLGGQNKTARLSNDRKIADQLAPYIQ